LQVPAGGGPDAIDPPQVHAPSRARDDGRARLGPSQKEKDCTASGGEFMCRLGVYPSSKSIDSTYAGLYCIACYDSRFLADNGVLESIKTNTDMVVV
jgi:hypothetical protein